MRARLGGETAERAAEADVCVINTCTVTREADRDCLRLLRQITSKNPSAQVVVTGCYATRAPEEIRAAAPHAVIAGNGQKDDIPALLGCGTLSPDEVEPAALSGRRSPGGAKGISGFHGHSRAFVKVQDGCNMECAYCIIPSVRPEMTSRPLSEALAEVGGLVENGYQEIVLCGVRLGRYLASDHSGPVSKRVDFVGLMERLLALPGDFRVRLSSFEITDLTDRLLRVLASSQGKFCPSFHLPLQSGSGEVLKKMKRWYSPEFYRRRVEALRQVEPEAGLFTDLMAGFPGETREEFERSLEFVEALDFSGLHVFRFSPRAGTPAAAFPQAAGEDEVMERAARMRQLDVKLRTRFAARSVGRRRQVIIEDGRRGREGLTEHFLRVSLGAEARDLAGLRWARVTAHEGPLARAVVE